MPVLKYIDDFYFLFMFNIHSVPLSLHAKFTEGKVPLHYALSVGVNPLH